MAHVELVLTGEARDGRPLTFETTVRAVVVTGAGTTFCAGFDLSEFTVDGAEFQRRLWASSDRYHRSDLYRSSPKT